MVNANVPVSAVEIQSPFLRAVRSFLETNYFYVISAGMMILGCYLLMRSTPVSGGEIQRVLTGLLVLQGYELLVLGTIGLIRRRLPTIEDTLTLVGVEMILLFDPTFFANNFHTLVQSDHANAVGPWVNVGALLLLPIKLWAVGWINGLRLSRGTWGWLLLAGGIIYLAPAVLATTDPVWGRTGTFLAVCWLSAVALVLPPSTDGVIASGRERIRSGLHHRWAPRFFMHFPAILLMAHLAETWFVHKIDFHGALLVPIFVTIGARALFHLQTASLAARIAILDAFVAASILASFPKAGISPKEVYNAPEPFFNSIGPLVVAGVAACLVYTLGSIRFRQPRLLLRPLLMAVGGCVALLHELGWLAIVWEFVRGVAGWLLENSTLIEGLLISSALTLSVAFWRPGFSLLSGLWMLTWTLRLEPVALDTHFAEMLQMLLALLLAVSAMEGSPSERAFRQGLILMIPLVALLRVAIAPFDWSLAVLIAEIALLFLFAVASQNRWLVAYSLGLAVLLSGWVGRSEILGLGAPALVIAAALALFAAGVFVSFRKDRLIAKLSALEGGEATQPPVSSSER